MIGGRKRGKCLENQNSLWVLNQNKKMVDVSRLNLVSSDLMKLYVDVICQIRELENGVVCMFYSSLDLLLEAKLMLSSMVFQTFWA